MEKGVNSQTDQGTEKTFSRKGSSRIRQLMNKSLNDSSYCNTDVQHYPLMTEENSDTYLMAKFGEVRRNTEHGQSMEGSGVRSNPVQSHRLVPEINLNPSKAQIREPSPSGAPPYSDRSSKQPE